MDLTESNYADALAHVLAYVNAPDPNTQSPASWGAGSASGVEVALTANELTSLGFTVRIGRCAFNLTTMGPDAERQALMEALSDMYGDKAEKLENVFDNHIWPVFAGDFLVGYEIQPMRGFHTQGGASADSFTAQLSLA
jgi:hypothetical protein